ncbi:MAG: hypothetical protein NZM43_11175 [Saprospiraceae bacterium]|nr:hypothetical protein [Saprospiraceae bacterium]MDW8484869.1 hypothetical protein [Saprospiraceae bacterium]
MRSKLQKFFEFSRTLLPHETTWLLSHQHFDDRSKVSILERVHANCHCLHDQECQPFDDTLDKRKYSSLKQWITDRLNALDVDLHLAWILDTERKILTDAVEPETETRLLHEIKTCQPTAFYFVKFYEMAQAYRHLLLIRMRYAEHAQVELFLQKNEAAWRRSLRISEELHQATCDIVNQYAGNPTPSIQWEQRLTDLFYDETLDGWNRYMALVRLTFIYYNYRRFEPLLEKYEYFERQLAEGKFYSKRILINYYGNRLLLHVRFREFDKAEYYGYLSIRVKNLDYVHYVNNLCAVLIRQKKYQQAFALLKKAQPESKKTPSFHNKIGFVSLYVQCLNHLGQYLPAEHYAETYLRAYPKEIFQHRWHLFFTVYLESLFNQRKFDRLLKVCKKYKLLERDAVYVDKPYYLPILRWYYAAAALYTQQQTLEQLKPSLSAFMPKQCPDTDKLSEIRTWIHQIKTVEHSLGSFLEELVQRAGWK